MRPRPNRGPRNGSSSPPVTRGRSHWFPNRSSARSPPRIAGRRPGRSVLCVPGWRSAAALLATLPPGGSRPNSTWKWAGGSCSNSPGVERGSFRDPRRSMARRSPTRSRPTVAASRWNSKASAGSCFASNSARRSSRPKPSKRPFWPCRRPRGRRSPCRRSGSRAAAGRTSANGRRVGPRPIVGGTSPAARRTTASIRWCSTSRVERP